LVLSLDLGDFLWLERFLFEVLPSALSFGCSESLFTMAITACSRVCVCRSWVPLVVVFSLINS
jgi:hypothetical protein